MNTCTQLELARKIGTSQSHVSEIFSGKKRPSIVLAARLEEVTGKHRLFWLYPDEYNEAGDKLSPPPSAPAQALTQEAP
jgi:transcriptional regulator with XRE-family HTH domain